jgi:hypothetical protein
MKTAKIRDWACCQLKKKKSNSLRQSSLDNTTCLAQLLAYIRPAQYVGHYFRPNWQHNNLPAPWSIFRPWQPLLISVPVLPKKIM